MQDVVRCSLHFTLSLLQVQFCGFLFYHQCAIPADFSILSAHNRINHKAANNSLKSFQVVVSLVQI